VLIPQARGLGGCVDDGLHDLQFASLLHRERGHLRGYGWLIQSQEGGQLSGGVDHVAEMCLAAALVVHQGSIPARECLVLDGFQFGGLLGLPDVLRDVDLGKFGLAFI